MHLYWRIQQDLNCLGDVLVFRDPCFTRTLREWVYRNAAGIALAEDWTRTDMLRVSVN
ncbi:MAG: hypothetical protein WAU91_21470 [Desulfatitalea sp.]